MFNNDPFDRIRGRSRSRSPLQIPTYRSEQEIEMGWRRVQEMEENIKRLDRSLAERSSRLKVDYEHQRRYRSPSPARRQSRRRSRSRTPPQHNMFPMDNFGAMDNFVRPEFVPNYIHPVYDNRDTLIVNHPANGNISFPSLWTHHDVQVDPVPIYPAHADEADNFDERVIIDIRQNMREDQSAINPSELKEIARKAENYKKQHLEEKRKQESEDAKKRRKEKEEEEKRDYERRKLEREKRHTNSRKEETSSRKKVEDDRRKRDADRNGKDDKSSTKSQSQPQNDLAFLNELNVALGNIVYSTKIMKTSKSIEYSTTCHITNIPKELISATSRGYTTEESAKLRSVEKFVDKLVEVGILKKELRDSFQKYKTLPVFLAGIMDSFCNDVAIYGTQISVTADRDMVTKFAEFVKIKSEEFWQSKQPIVDAFLKCQTAEENDKTQKTRRDEYDEKEKRKEREREKDREREHERERERKRERERSRENRHRRRSRTPNRAASTNNIAEMATNYIRAQMTASSVYQSIVPQMSNPFGAPQPGPPGVPPPMNMTSLQQFNPMISPPVAPSFNGSIMPQSQFPTGPSQQLPMQQFVSSTQQVPMYPQPDYPVSLFQGANITPQPLMGPPAAGKTRNNLVQVKKVQLPSAQQQPQTTGKKKNRHRNKNKNKANGQDNEIDLFEEVFK